MPLNSGHILVVDDDQDILLSASLLLKRRVQTVNTLANANAIPDFLQRNNVDVMLLDMNFTLGDNSGDDGFYWLDRVQKNYPHVVIIVMTAYAGVELAVRAIKSGATDFVIKPWTNDKLVGTVVSAVELAQSRRSNTNPAKENSIPRAAKSSKHHCFIAESVVMQALLRKVNLCAATETNILILGENGSGKEVLAREIHARSARADAIFMAIDMGAIAESLFEAELFGHTKGAFTGADQARRGRLAAANGGTLFLDEIANLPMHLQVKLLRVLEQREVIPLGDEKSIALDVRVIAATNAPYRVLADETRFRQDLLYRLNTVELTLPPLRERKDDIPHLVDHYLEVFAHKYQRRKPGIARMTMNALVEYSWPGNVRSLCHALERALVLSDNSILTVEDFALAQVPLITGNEPGVNTLHLETLEKTAVNEALKKHSGNISQAAKELGLTRTALYRRMEKHDL